MKQSLSTQGSSLIEVMVALGLVGLVALGIFALSQDILNYIQRNKIGATRDQLATQFRQNAGRIRNLQLSLTKSTNQNFFNCICGKGSGCSSGKAYDLFLYDPSSPNTPIQAYYDDSGNPCNQTADNCIIKVTLTFVPQCLPTLPSSDPTPPAVCVGVPVEFFSINYTVQQKSSTQAQGSFFKPISGSVFTQVSDLAPAGSGICP